MTSPVPLSIPQVVSALGRAGFGARPEEAAEVAARGFPAWVEEQLAVEPRTDPVLADRLARLRLRIHYAAGASWAAVDELRPLAILGKPIEAAWPLIVERKAMDGAERRRAREEVIAATILGAVHSRWQLREAMTSFWHDHFNVDAWGSEEVAVALPAYDRDVIRRHALGNFRAFLEAVAKSAAMLFYLSNRSSRAGAANENYARELFELHTLGRECYLNDRYDRWRSVPGALKGAPDGYIDEDVYEAARAFTGWTVEDGARIDGQRVLPTTGRFAYVETWHDGYQKRVLAHEFQEFAPALADGRRVLDLVAHHPGTARFVCSKLVRRFVGDDPPPRLVAAAAAVWARNINAKDQIAEVVRTILLSPEFMAAQGAKVRRPLALVAAFARATGLDLVPAEPLWNTLAAAGQRLFGWPPPTGLPDEAGYFLGANSMRQRWQLVLAIAENPWGTGSLPLPPALAQTAATPRTAVLHFAQALFGAPPRAVVDGVLAGLGWRADEPLGDPGRPEFGKRLARIAALVAMAPEFQSA